ncbi:S9 family peptidase [Pseudoalteromonas sp. 1_2015MBL_MicDiv]|uniref:S9 family peptidase n=1 Tax=Pseudoalteromonas sp. 1_2015MBL_MicDiv TaxID=1720343 RepID=UPI000BBE704B|nr:prolyl oligopeptidase family serine peptidase [Pseudoalteromonas sp. 1_2015MBL_MicDiv]ATG79122.1 hypothetical protein AOR04_17100 [Pseudoalteromonas sp. 1_2015MBL_MicDiv]
MNKFYLIVALWLIAPSPVEAIEKDNSKWANLIESTGQETISLSPDGEQVLFLHQIKYPSIKYLSQQRIQLAGLDFYTNLSSRVDTKQYSRATLFNISKNSREEIKTVEGVIVDFNWSPDAKKIAFLIQNNTNTHLWLHDVIKNDFKKLTNINLSTSLGDRHLRWLPNGQAIIVKKRNSPIKSSEYIRKKPNLLSSDLQTDQGRTHQSLLINDEMKNQFISINQTKLVKVNLNGEVSILTESSLLNYFSVSPDGNYLLYSMLPNKLSSYLPYKKWGRSYNVINIESPTAIYNLPNLNDKINLPKSKDSVPIGARLVKWLPSHGSTISWVEASDKGDMSLPQIYHDHIYKLESPFSGNKKLIHQVTWRVHDVLWGLSGTGILQDWRYDSKQARTTLINAQTPTSTLIHQRDYRDKYNDFGDPQTLRTPAGYEVLVEQNNNLFFFSSGQSKKGIRPIAKHYNTLSNLNKTIFLSNAEHIEMPLWVANNTLIIQKQNNSSAPQYYALTNKSFKKKVLLYSSENKNKLTNQPVNISYKRNDGLDLTGTLHLPNSYNISDKIPAILWIYPDEFKNKKLSQQNTVRTNLFREFDPLSPLVFLHDGFAVFESPSMPITSFDGSEPNDDFINQIHLNAKAAVNALEKTGRIDVQKLAVMGHSYGAFTVANLLAHTDLFKAGIARSGAYNRTLTPFGFQGEKRNLWQAKETYINISPLIYADKINEPLLLVHGESDQNSGTYPMQSMRMYQALIANKKTAQLIMLPYEGHTYQAKENLSYLLTHQSEWMKKWLNTSK